jgi:membrane peptidoglycan carboxypeptidase
MATRKPARIRTKAGHKPRARVHAGWSPIGQRARRTALVRALGVLLGLLLVTGLAADAYAQEYLSSLPSIEGLDATRFSGDVLVYDRGGTKLADLGNQGDRRLIVKLSDISPKLVEATVAIEDKNFWRNSGFDVEGIARAALANLRSGSIVGGGSTITQQLAKRLLLTPQQTLDRKVKEVILAYQLSHAYSKQQILELYLNESYYGDQNYGIEAAAETYFHTTAAKLDLAQAAMLAGLPQAPAEWSPLLHPDAARARQNEVLQAMVRNGDITPADASQAAAEKLSVYPPVNTFLAPHFVDYVQKELEQLGFKAGQEQLIVRTTLDYGKQKIAEQVVRDNLADNLWRDPGGLLSSALVSMDPKTGQILAMVGSPDYNSRGGQYNFTADVAINPGSSIKPFMYGAVINARKATMDTPIYDGPNPLVLPQGEGQPDYKVYNYDRATHGVLPLRMTLANSLNIPAVKAELSIGVPATVEFMRNLGIYPRAGCPEGHCDRNASVYDYGAAVTLGGYPITLLEEVNGLSTYAAMGVYHQPEAILSVTDVKGDVLYQADAQRGARQAIDPGVAFVMASIMSDDQNRAMIFGLGSPLHLPDRTAAAKTGTTDDFRDALTIGFTPDLATVIWVGDILDLNHAMVQGSDGVFVAAPGWHSYMEQALAGVPDRWYDPPADVVKGPGNSWYLQDATSVARLPNDNPVASPSPPSYGIPPDPGTGPVRVAGPAPAPSPSGLPLPHPSPQLP